MQGQRCAKKGVSYQIAKVGEVDREKIVGLTLKKIWECLVLGEKRNGRRR